VRRTYASAWLSAQTFFLVTKVRRTFHSQTITAFTMLTPSDILHLPYTTDLTEGGIAFACRLLVNGCNRMAGSPFDHLRSVVAGAAVELAFRRLLSEKKIPFRVLGAEPFTHPDHYDVSLGGHRCNVMSSLISRRRQIVHLHLDPGLALQAPALVPLDQFAAEGHKPGDLYLFAFFLGLTAASQDDVERALAAGQPAYLVHPLPDEWARPVNWLPFESLVLKSECEAPINVELGGQDAERNFVTTTLELPPRKRLLVKQTFFSLAYVHAGCRPAARIGLHSPRCGEAYVIQPFDWGNIWVYGMDIVLTGYLSHEDFRSKASVLNAGMPTFQYAHTRMKNLSVPMTELNPLGNLFQKVREWEDVRSTSIVRRT
jgi:hypothetical protein